MGSKLLEVSETVTLTMLATPICTDMLSLCHAVRLILCYGKAYSVFRNSRNYTLGIFYVMNLP